MIGPRSKSFARAFWVSGAPSGNLVTRWLATPFESSSWTRLLLAIRLVAPDSG
jgi:hypothetical protein